MGCDSVAWQEPKRIHYGVVQLCGLHSYSTQLFYSVDLHSVYTSREALNTFLSHVSIR